MLGTLTLAAVALVLAAPATASTRVATHPPRTGAYGVLGEACPPVGSCVAVASRAASTEPVNGGQRLMVVPGRNQAVQATAAGFAAMTIPHLPGLSADPFDALSDLTCPASRTCAAIGDDVDVHDNVVPVVFWWNGSTWSVTQVPVPPGTDTSATGFSVTVNALACASVSSCALVGLYTPKGDESGAAQPLVVEGSGTSWSAVQAPVPPDAQSTLRLLNRGGDQYPPLESLEDVISMPDGDYVIAGSYSRAVGYGAVFLTGSGSSWTMATVDSPASAVQYTLADVTCLTVDQCVAIGGWSPDASVGTVEAPLLYQGSGSTWQQVNLPAAASAPGPGDSGPAGPAGYDVACATSGPCVATLGYSALVLVGHGADWTVQHTPKLGGLPMVAAGVTCIGVTCVASGFTQLNLTSLNGYHTDPAIMAASLQASGAAPVWRARLVRYPTAKGLVSGAGVGSLSCTAHGSCIAALEATLLALPPTCSVVPFQGFLLRLSVRPGSAGAWPVSETLVPLGATPSCPSTHHTG